LWDKLIVFVAVVINLYYAVKVKVLSMKLNPLTTAIGRPFFGHKSPAARARELFKPFTDSAIF